MAVTKIWRVRGSAGRVIDYANNPEKTALVTDGEEFTGLEDVLEYADDETKTEKHFYTTGINCDREYAKEEFQMTKARFGKQGGIVAIHGYQSFEEENITPEKAHEIGVQLAKELWGERFQVIVATHLNTDHIHTHFVINSISFKDGKRFHMCTARYLEMREVSDRLCKEHNLSVIEDPKGRGAGYHLHNLEKAGMPTRHVVARAAIDKAISRSLNMDEFKAELRAMDFNFQLDHNRKHWTITVPNGKKPIRIDGLGPEYSKERIMERIFSNDESVRTIKYRETYYRQPNSYHLKRRIHKINTRTGLEKLYLKVCYEMGFLPKYRHDPLKVNYIFRDELLRCDMYAREARLLSENHVSTAKDLFELKRSKENRIDDLMANREELRKRMKQRTILEEEKEEIKEKVTALTSKIKDLRGDLKLIEDIEVRSGHLEEKLNELERVKDRKENER